MLRREVASRSGTKNRTSIVAPRRRVLLIARLFLLLLAGPNPNASAASEDPTPADSLSAAVADTVSSDPDSSASVPIEVRLEDGTIEHAVRVKRTSRESLLLVLTSGESRFVPVYRVRSIQDEKGRDRTREVMEGWNSLAVTFRSPGDSSSASKPKKESRFLRGYPLPERRRYVVMEFGYMTPLSRAKQGREMSGYGVWQLAYLNNLNETYAIGPAIQAEYGGSEGRFSGMVRGRKWLSREASLELSLGASVGTRASAEESIRSTGPSIFLQGAANLNDAVILTVQAESFVRDYPAWYDTYPGSTRIGDTERGIQVLAGGRFGGALGVAAAGTGALIYVALIAILIAGETN